MKLANYQSGMLFACKTCHVNIERYAYHIFGCILQKTKTEIVCLVPVFQFCHIRGNSSDIRGYNSDKGMFII